MKDKILKGMLPFFYVFAIGSAIIYGIDYYNEIQKQKERLLIIDKTLEVENTGTQVKLELNNQNKQQEVIYEVQDDNIVKVDESGNLISVGEGTTTVTVTNKEGTKTQTFVVSVGEEAIKEINKNEEKVDQLIEENKVILTPNNNSSSINNNSEASKPETSVDNSTNTNTNKNNTTQKPETNKNNTTSKPTTIRVTGITLNKSSETVYINNTKTITLSATVYPSNAANKNITWSTSNSNVATVNNGVVTVINPGNVIITATTSDGGHKAQYNLSVNKKVVIIIGASQVVRMTWYKTSYNSSNYRYNTNNGTLVYVADGGTGINFQNRQGFNQAKNTINTYSNVKSNVSFHIFFPMPGNTIKNFTCDEISSTNPTIMGYAKDYNESIQTLKNNGYTVKGYVVSSHPVKPSQAKKDVVVTNENSNACAREYRSNWKYFQFNKAMNSLVKSNYSTNLKYESVFVQIMETNTKKKNFSYKMTYNTTDGVHWDEATTKKYIDLMLGYTNDL